jgi:hypothetical protein
MKYFIIFFVVTFSFSVFSKAEVKLVEVSAKGVGVERSEAINEALLEAIGKVNGKTLDAKNTVTRQLKTASQNGHKNTSSSSEISKAYNEATQGVVDSFEIISENIDGRGRFVIQVRANIAKLQLSNKSNRTKVAILPFSSSDELKGNSGFKRNFEAALSNKLVSSRRFKVLDREYQSDILSERKLALSSSVISPADALKYGFELAADYVVVGTIENVDFEHRSKYFPMMEREVHFPVGRTAINLKIIDVTTKQTLFSKNFISSFGYEDFKTLYGNGISPSPDVALAELSSLSVGKEILNAIYPIMISAVNGKSLTLNQGGDLVKNMTHYEIFERGDKLYDPYTKESLGRDELYVGELKVTRVNPKFSKAELVKGDINKMSDGFQLGRYIIREKQTNQNAKSDEIKKRIDKESKKIDEEW